jgi:hypothetical protein
VRVREGIARALAVPEAITEWDTLVQLFEGEADTTTEGAKWGLACALSAASNDAVIEDMIRLIGDRRHGKNRIGLIDGLARSADPRALNALKGAAGDSQLESEVNRAIKHAPRAREEGVPKGATMRSEVSGLSEVSIAFDLSEVEPFLRRAAGLVSGLGPREIRQVIQLLDDLEVDTEGDLLFEVIHDGERVPLRILAFMDDVNAPDLTFVTAPKLAGELGDLAEQFSDEHGG